MFVSGLVLDLGMMSSLSSEPEEEDLAAWGVARIKDAANLITESIDVPTLLLMQAAFVLGRFYLFKQVLDFHCTGLVLKDFFSFDASSLLSRLLFEATSKDEEATRSPTTTEASPTVSPTPLPLFSPIHPRSREIRPRVELLYDQIEVELGQRKVFAKIFFLPGVSYMSGRF